MENDTVGQMLVCRLSEEEQRITATLAYMSVKVVIPTLFFIAVPVYSFLLVVLLKETFTEGAYAYQALVIGGKALETLTSALLNYSYYCAGFGNPGFAWYKSWRVLIFYTAHLAAPAHQFGTFLSLYLATCMSVDRLSALLRPLAYKLQNRRCQICAAVVVSAATAAVPSVYLYWYFEVVPNSDGIHYDAVINVEFYFGDTKRAMLIVSVFMRVFGVAALVVGNLLLVYNFRHRFVRTVPSTSSVAGGVGGGEKEQKRKSKERSLFLLTLWQSAFCCLASTIQVITAGMLAFFVQFQCYSDMVASLDLMLVQVVVLLEAIVPFAFNKNLRTISASIFRPKRPTISAATSERQQQKLAPTSLRMESQL